METYRTKKKVLIQKGLIKSIMSEYAFFLICVLNIDHNM